MILNVTLPAAIILNLADMQIQMDALALILIAVIITFVQIMTAFFLTKKRMMCYVSFRCIVAPGSISEISRFLLHKSFYPLGIPLISLFDMGNSIMLAGGTTILIEYLIGKRTVFEPGKIILNLLRSPTFTCYLFMLLIRSFGLSLPQG